MLAVSTAIGQRKSAHSYEGWIRIKSAKGFHQIKSWRRRYITLDGSTIRIYEKLLKEPELEGEIVTAKSDSDVDTTFKIEVTTLTKQGGTPKNTSFLVEPEEPNKSKARSLLLSMSAAVAVSQSKSLQRGASAKEIARARTLVDNLKKTWGFIEPDRGNLDDPTLKWHEGKPDYTVTNLAYFLGKSKNHQEGSLELVVENLVKTWEMEATHKPYEQWSTVNLEKYRVSANGGEFIPGKVAAKTGNYNWLLANCPKHLYDSSKETFESSHHFFLKAFPHGFPWEVLEVYSGPPKFAFTWRHWATFAGEFRRHKGNGEIVELTGFGVLTLEDMKICDLEIFYDGNKFIEVLMGLSDPEELKTMGAARGDPIVLTGCPVNCSSSNLSKNE